MFRLYCEAGRSRLPGREADIARVAAVVDCPPGKGGQPLPGQVLGILGFGLVCGERAKCRPRQGTFS